MAIRIGYNVYEEYPEATSISKAFRLSNFFVVVFSVCTCILSFSSNMPILGFFLLLLSIIWIPISSKVEKRTINRIVATQKPLSELSKEISITDDEMLIAYAKRIKGEYYISKGKNHPETVHEAMKVRMDTEKYIKHCKLWESQYNEKLRRYNLTHALPFDVEKRKKDAILLIEGIEV